MIDSIHAALWEWFLQCSAITKLFFNFSTAKNADTVITTAGDSVLEEYIDGSQRRRYAFELSRFCPISFTKNDPGNVDMLEDAQAIAAWVEQQNDAGNLPALPNGCIVESVVLLDEYAGFVTAQNENTARYMIPFALDYTKSKG
ncbi:MAG: hypothetical protein IJ466_11535 [Clostridia bacterium]|nr:hypothetical protein [Clostridia bacterium]